MLEPFGCHGDGHSDAMAGAIRCRPWFGIQVAALAMSIANLGAEDGARLLGKLTPPQVAPLPSGLLGGLRDLFL